MAISIEAKKAKKPGHDVIRYSYFNKTRKYFSTGIVIPREDFQKKIERPVRSSNPNAAHYNRMAAEIYNKIISTSNQLFREGITPTANLVNRNFCTREIKQDTPRLATTLTLAFNRFMMAENYDAHTRKIYNVLFKDLLGCFGDRDMENFGIEDWQTMLKYLKSKNLSINTICIRLTKFKHFLVVLVAEGINIMITKFPKLKEEIKKVSLSKESVQQIRDFKPNDRTLKQVREMCLFQCYTGLRISDFLRLEKGHLVQRNGMYQLSISSYKTNRKMFIPLTMEVYEIFKGWGFEAPRITEQHYNRLLKVLVKEAGIEQEVEWESYDKMDQKIRKREKLYKIVTSHACGRTALSYFMANYDPRDLCAILGKNMRTILKYYYVEATEDDILDKQMKVESQSKFIKVA